MYYNPVLLSHSKKTAGVWNLLGEAGCEQRVKKKMFSKNKKALPEKRFKRENRVAWKISQVADRKRNQKGQMPF